jgi:CheY-like chemotaxis protein
MLRFGDPVRVKQILANLVSNAIKFTETGEVAIKISGLQAGPTWLRIAVKDTGIGIPSDRHGAIFDSFTQADGSTTRRYGGTGLGLAIVKQLAALMGGKAGMTSEPGHGSTFWVDLPMELQAVDTQPADFRESLEGLKILVVDDNSTNRKVLTRLLATHGCTTDEAPGATDAIELLTRKGPYNIILLDYQMPDVDGLELARMITRMNLSPAPELVMLSSVGQLVGPDVLESAKVARSLTKPVRQNELLSVVLDVSRGSKARHEMENAPVKSCSLSSMSILVVEDNFVNRKVCQKILERHGCLVHFAENGLEALERVEAKAYDLILMDLQMPIMDGFETTLAIRARDRRLGIHTPIVALTAHAMRGDKEKCLAIGMDDYLTKPVKPQDIDTVIERYSALMEAA